MTAPENRIRPPWVDDDLLAEYYDYEWGKEAASEQEVFEKICLEGFQVGLAWKLVLQRRPLLRRLFHDFDVDRCTELSDAELEQILTTEGMIRNRRKVMAVRKNAQATVALRSQGGLVAFVEQFRPADHVQPRDISEIPAKTDESAALAKALKSVGFTMVGPVNMYALMQATGLVNDRVVGHADLIPRA